MRLSAREFKQNYEDETLKLAFIGMSNIGKSYTAERLADTYNFNLIEIDKRIQDLLGQESMEGFARWQGQPYEVGYADREKKSIELETQATRTAIKNAKGNLILDTPGSVIYTGTEVLESLKEKFVIVYIAAASDDIERLKSEYHARPKPLIWADHYKNIEGRSEEESIFDCYPALLRARAKRYAALADVTLDSRFVVNTDITVFDIFDALTG